MKYIKHIKYIILLPILISATYSTVILIVNILDKPLINDVKNLNINEQINKNLKSINNEPLSDEPKKMITSFNYKLIGYLYGPSDSSIILKKGSNEYLLRIGDKIESYELVNISDKEVIFSLQGNLYKIDNTVGKNK